MAKTTEQLIIEIKAQADDALRDMKRLEKMADDLEKGVDIEVKLDGAGARAAQDLTEQAERMSEELGKAKVAAERLGTALGPELAGRVNMNALLGDFKKLGLTMDDVAADADELAAAVKAIDDVKIDAEASGLTSITEGSKNAKGEVEGLSDSARGANSALANMVGNASQDLGALGGLAGSAGVAIGQMAEYAADATLGGEGLAKSLGSMAKVAGPIAIMSGAMAAMQSVMQGIEFTKTFDAANVEQYTAALREARTVAASVKEEVQATGEFEFDTAGGGFAGLGRHAKDILPDIEAVVGSLDEFNSIAAELADTGVSPRLEDIKAQLNAIIVPGSNATDAQRELAGSMMLVVEAAEQQATDTAKATANLERLKRVTSVTTDEVENAVDAWERLNDPVSAFPAEFKRIAAALASGATPAAKDMETVTEGLGITMDKALDIAADYNEQIGETGPTLEEAAAAASKAKVDLAHVTSELDDLSSTFAEMGRSGDALERVFSLGNAGRTAAGQVRDINLAIGDLSESLKGVKVSDVLAGDVGADKFLDAIDAIVPDIQQKITEAFSTGGPEAATAMANSYIDQVTAELGGKFTREQVAALLGLDNLPVTIQAAVDQASLAQAQATLATLVGLGGETPYTASIALALQTGELTPAAAQILINNALGGEGVSIPAELAQPATEEALASANKFLADNPGILPVTAKTDTVETDVGTVRGSVEDTPAELTIETDDDTASDDIEGLRGDVEDDPAKLEVDLDDATAKADIRKLIKLLEDDPADLRVALPNLSSVSSQLADLARPRTVDITIRTIEDSVDRWYRLNAGGG